MSSTSTVDAPDGPSTYKGKVTNRSWAQLPEELVRIIATYYILDASISNYCPEQWQQRPFWHNRMVYTALRDSLDVERFMSICPQWGAAVETHMFWQHAVSLVDPLDTMGAHAWVRVRHNTNSSAAPPPPIRMTPFQHFRNLTRASCTVCRINAPNGIHGLGTGKRIVYTPYLGYTSVCRDHDRHPAAYCGLCLREKQSVEVELQIQNHPQIQANGMAMNSLYFAGCVENEDLETWPHIEATCRSCRSEALFAHAHSLGYISAVGGRKFRIDDWEAKSTVDSFLEHGEGRMKDVIMVAREREWMRMQTKLADMLSQAMAATRFDDGAREERLHSTATERAVDVDNLDLEMLSETGVQVGADVEEEDEEEDSFSDDFELAQLTEDSGIRDLALGDWARNRVLDGFWISPVDQWEGVFEREHPWESVAAVHPCPWTLKEEEEPEIVDGISIPHTHPLPATLHSPIPPSQPLTSQSHTSFTTQLRLILLPAMKNIVRRLVIEGNEDGVDPAIRATRMGFEEIMKELREGMMWFEGVDWVERRRNEGHDKRASDTNTSKGDGSDDHSTSSSSKSSDESSTSSPVLSTTTVQTTPSPPPIHGESGKMDVDVNVNLGSTNPRPITIAVAPVLNPPRLIHPIPYVPLIAAHLPEMSLEAFRSVWREACAPLYHCRCKICERAQAAQAAAAALVAGVAAIETRTQDHDRNPNPSQNQNQQWNQEEPQKKAEVVQIQLDEVDNTTVDGEGEGDADGEGDLEYLDEIEDDFEEELDEEEVEKEAEEVEGRRYGDIDDDGVRSGSGYIPTYLIEPSEMKTPTKTATVTRMETGKEMGQVSRPHSKDPLLSLRQLDPSSSPSSPSHRPRKRSCDEIEVDDGQVYHGREGLSESGDEGGKDTIATTVGGSEGGDENTPRSRTPPKRMRMESPSPSHKHNQHLPTTAVVDLAKHTLHKRRLGEMNRDVDAVAGVGVSTGTSANVGADIDIEDPQSRNGKRAKISSPSYSHSRSKFGYEDAEVEVEVEGESESPPTSLTTESASAADSGAE